LPRVLTVGEPLAARSRMDPAQVRRDHLARQKVVLHEVAEI